jgi:hypothetical protein
MAAAYKNRRTVTVESCGVKISDCIVFQSQYPGFDPISKRRIKPGDLIAFKSKEKLTADQCKAIWPDGRRFNFTVLWPLQGEASHNGGKPSFPPSEYQEVILKTLLETEDHIFIRALAGSGKTATLVWLVYELKSRNMLAGKNVLYMAFGKRDQTDLADRLAGTNVDVLTTHAFGFRLLKSVYGTDIKPIKSNQFYGDIFIRMICDKEHWDYSAANFKKARKSEIHKLHTGVCELVGYIKNWANFPNQTKDGYAFDSKQKQIIKQYIGMYEIEMPENWEGNHDDWENSLVELACQITCLSIPIPGQSIVEIAFDDMLYLPLALNLDLPYYDLLFTDESQDFNACQVLLLERLQHAEKR